MANLLLLLSDDHFGTTSMWRDVQKCPNFHILPVIAILVSPVILMIFPFPLEM